MKNLNVHVSDEFHARLKMAVVLEKTDISKVVRRFLEKYVEKVEKKRKSK